MSYTIQQINNIIVGKSTSRITNADAVISNLLTDSRNLAYAEGTLFFALRTATGDGHHFIGDLYQQGVRNFIVDESFSNQKEFSEANFIVVNNPLNALQQLAAYHRAQFSFPIIGITGSNGKTIVKEWLYQLLQNQYQIVRSPKSYNSQIGIPLSLWGLHAQAGIGLFEAGISRTGEMERAEQMIRPTIGVFTNLGTAHQEGFASAEEKLHEKLLLFKHSHCLVYCKNYPLEAEMRTINPNIQFFSWGYNDESASLNILSTQKEPLGTRINYVYQQKRDTCFLPFSDAASIENGIHCLSCCLYLGVAPAIDKLVGVGMRLEVKQGKNNCLIIDDAYNSDINSIAIALDFMQANAEHKFSKRTLILSDIMQSGLRKDDLYNRIASLCKAKQVQRVIGIGPDISSYWNLFPFDSQFFKSTAEFLEAGIRFESEIVLIKGARCFHLEKIVSVLEQKRHQTVMEINLNALVHNFKTLKSLLKPETKTMAMIKANAYGCGAIEVAQTLAHHHCDYFGVAVADEGVELRAAGVVTDIIVMDPEPNSFALLTEHHLQPEIYSFDLLRQFIDFTRRQGITGHPIHIKVDTGMHRLGFLPEEMPALVRMLKKSPSVKVGSVFSHLVASEDEGQDAFTLLQMERFKQASDYLHRELGYTILRHILNTSGIERLADYQYDMVRMGIGLYGVGINHVDIQNIATLKTVILQIKKIAKEETVGYNRRGLLMRDTVVATIPIGYADGLNRGFGRGNGYALVHGWKAPFLGNICMDVCMIDITDIPNVQVGDTVTIFNDELTISDLASRINTIPYEILTGISNRVKRIYYQE